MGRRRSAKADHLRGVLCQDRCIALHTPDPSDHESEVSFPGGRTPTTTTNRVFEREWPCVRSGQNELDAPLDRLSNGHGMEVSCHLLGLRMGCIGSMGGHICCHNQEEPSVRPCFLGHRDWRGLHHCSTRSWDPS